MPKGRVAEESAVAFYGGVLGLERVAKPTALSKRGGLWFEKAELRVHLGVEEPFHPALKAHPAFEVGRLEAMCEKLASHEIAFSHGREIPGIRRIYVSNPFGNRIEILQIL